MNHGVGLGVYKGDLFCLRSLLSYADSRRQNYSLIAVFFESVLLVCSDYLDKDRPPVTTAVHREIDQTCGIIPNRIEATYHKIQTSL